MPSCHQGSRAVIQRSRGTVPRGCACSFGTAQRRRFACYYGVRNQSSMFHMSDAVLGFLKKFSNLVLTTRAELR